MISFWMESAADRRTARPALTGERTADVCIVGGGYTGLWTAYELLRAEPSLDIVVLEAESIGFGASGRNGGWVLGAIAGDRKWWARRSGREGVVTQDRAVRETVGYVGQVIEHEHIDCDFVHGGTLRVAETALERSRLEQAIAFERSWGAGAQDTVLLDAGALSDRLHVPGAIAAKFSPHCARVQPAKLAAGLAAAVERHGATIYERSRVSELAPGRVATAGGAVIRARHVVRATEAYTAGLPGLHRALLPMRSSMIITAPLDDATWRAIGWDGMETIGDSRHVYIYAQRTADGRIAIGGRGKPYRFGSDTEGESGADPSVAAELRARLTELFPVLSGVGVDATWQGVLGVSRPWRPTVSFDRASGMAWAGGYVGEGVAAANLAARTLTDLLLDRDTELSRLPWVAPMERKWEPEPLRWIGVNAVYESLRRADASERRSGKASPLAIPAKLLGITH
jgi:glycine/D-amino acid oxidase-like deaminating enzyme